MGTRCLSFHASYRCRHAGACCAAPWQVKADDHVVRIVRGSTSLSRHAESVFINQVPRPGAVAELSLAKDADGVCVFRAGRRCAIHTHAGESALPIGCRHYPRVARIDPDAITLSLSHYCPTAAALLVSGDPVRVVTAAPPLELSDPIEGLDARSALPPLLRPDVLMDVEAYASWELAVVNTLMLAPPDAALGRIAAATDALREWIPGSMPLEAAVRGAFESDMPPSPLWPHRGLEIARSLNHGPIPLPRCAPRVTGNGKRVTDQVIANYLAARVFGNWIAYQGRGLRTIVAWLHACYDVVCTLAGGANGSTASVPAMIEAIRQADYVMLHTIDTQEFANAAREVEA